jgi:glycosyltransferase involved in cell wall biosynthesis
LADFDPIYVPHGVDTEAYKPHERNEIRDKLGVSHDAFLVGIVAANKGRPSRKCFQQMFEAFRHFRKRHPDAEIKLYVHTTVEPEYAGGEDILALLASLELHDAIRPDSYTMMFDPVSSRSMAQIYSTFDVLLNASMGEGFGIPILEAAACGVPSIVTDFSAMSEVCGAGWKVPGRPFWTGQHSWMQVPDVKEIVDALEDCYGLDEGRRRALSVQARQHAEQYDAKRVFEDYMLPGFQEVEERIGDLAPLKVAA